MCEHCLISVSVRRVIIKNLWEIAFGSLYDYGVNVTVWYAPTRKILAMLICQIRLRRYDEHGLFKMQWGSEGGVGSGGMEGTFISRRKSDVRERGPMYQRNWCSSPSNAPVSSSCPFKLLLCCHRFFFNNPSLKFEDFAWWTNTYGYF